MVLKTAKFDAAEFLKTDEEITDFLNDAFATGTSEEISHALGIVARVKGMTKMAKATGRGRASLYKTFSISGNPEFSAVVGLVHAAGLTLKVEPAANAARSKPERKRKPSKAAA